MRSLIKVTNKQSEVVIIDSIGSEWLKYCIPEECSQSCVEIHHKVPFICSILFPYRLLRYIVRYGLTSVSLLSSIISILKPKVVITFIDNNKFMGPMQDIFPDILFISVQNGTRLNEPTYTPNGSFTSFPHYFGFGSHELKMMSDAGAGVKHYYAVGSLKMGVFLSNLYKPVIKESERRKICFISPYSNGLAKSPDENCIQFMSMNQKLCGYLFQFSQENDVDIVIALRNELGSVEYEEELAFFEEVLGDSAVYSANNRKEMLSYQRGMESDLIVSVISTLLYELLGVNKKILCFNFAQYMKKNKMQSDAWAAGFVNDERQYDMLPDDLLMSHLSYDEFAQKARILLEMSDDSYAKKTQSAKECYMHFGNQYPHNAIRNLIASKC